MNFLIVLLFSIFVGSQAAKCKYDKQELEHDEIIKVQDAFLIKCIVEENGSWRTEIAGCVTPSGDNLNVTEKKETDEKVFECVKNEGGQVVLKETRGSKAPCQGGHKFEDEWVERSFKFKCTEGGVTSFIGCVPNNATFIKDGEVGKVDGFDIKCQKHANGTVTMESANAPESYECKTNEGTTVKFGETYKDKNFVRKCETYGRGILIGCNAPNVDLIPFNQNVTADGVVHSCTKDGNQVKYQAFGDPRITAKPQCWFEGKAYDNGSELITQEIFRTRCLIDQHFVASFEFFGCVTPKQKINIPIGETIDEGDRSYKCERSETGQINIVDHVASTTNCRNIHRPGDTWTEGSFKYQCGKYGREDIISCVTLSGIEVKVNNKKQLDSGKIIECVIEANHVFLRTAKNSPCIDNLGRHLLGSKWKYETFMYQCNEGGVRDVIGCYHEKTGELQPDSEMMVDGLNFRCIREGKNTFFKYNAVGVATKTTLKS